MVFAVSLFIEGIFDSEKTQMTPTICPMKSISYSSERGDRSMTVQNFIANDSPKRPMFLYFLENQKHHLLRAFLFRAQAFPYLSFRSIVLHVHLRIDKTNVQPFS